jgi:3-deoxy-D-manno-octulosonic-acid transferase
MMRFAYNAFTYLLSPVYGLYWIFRGIKNRSYWRHLGQRFGIGCPQLAEGCIWVHAVSVGEVQASAPLVKALAKRFPDRQLLVTTVTPTGRARAQRLFGDEVAHCYLPFETPIAVKKFFDATAPQIALIMETEIWPNLYYTCGRRRIPLILVSARISPKSIARYRKLLPLFRETLSYGIVIAAQSQLDADRFEALGTAPERTSVTGNIKFDIETDESVGKDGAELRRNQFAGRPVWIAASTHDKEEELVLAAHRLIRHDLPNALLILVPRHPERFSNVRSLLDKQHVPYVLRTANRPCSADTQVLLGDTMGEVPLLYAAGDVAFVGGTLVPIGGHNLLEPAALGKPVVTGPHLFSTQEIADMFSKVGASQVIHDERELAQAVLDLLANPEKARAAGEKGFALLQQNRGALQRLLDLLEPTMNGVSTYPWSKAPPESSRQP